MSNACTYLGQEFPALLLSSCTPTFLVAFLLQFPSPPAVLLKRPVRPTNDKLILKQEMMTKRDYSGSMLTLKSIISFWEWNRKQQESRCRLEKSDSGNGKQEARQLMKVNV